MSRGDLAAIIKMERWNSLFPKEDKMKAKESEAILEKVK